MKAATQVSTFR